MAVAILWLAFREVDVRRVQALVVGLGWLALLIPIPMLASFCCETVGWRWAFQLIGRQTRLLPLLRVRVATDALTHSLPGGVVLCESTALFLLKRHCGVPMVEGVAGIAARKYLLLLSQCIYVGLIFGFGFSYLQGASMHLLGTGGLAWVVLAISAILGLAAFGVAATLHRGAVVTRVHALLWRVPVRRFQAFLEARHAKFEQADDQIARFFGSGLPRRIPPALSFLAGWVAESFETWLILQLLGVDLSFAAVASFEVILAFVRHVLVLLPAGLGVQDAGYVAFLAALGAADALSVGAAFVLLKRSKEVLWAAVGYALLLLDRTRTDPAELPADHPLGADST